MKDDWIAQAVRPHVRDGSLQKDLTGSEIERRQRETVRRLEAALVEWNRTEKKPLKSELPAASESLGWHGAGLLDLEPIWRPDAGEVPGVQKLADDAL